MFTKVLECGESVKIGLTSSLLCAPVEKSGASEVSSVVDNSAINLQTAQMRNDFAITLKFAKFWEKNLILINKIIFD